MTESEIVMAIHRAIKQGRLSEVIRIIGEDKSRLHMMTPFGTWLHDAAALGKLEIVRWCVSQCLDVNAYGETTEVRPLDEAAANGHVDVVRFLIDSGSSLDVEESIRNPLFSAIVGGISASHTEVAKLLIDSGIDTTVSYTGKYMTKMDALAFAREWGRSDIVELLETERRKHADQN